MTIGQLVETLSYFVVSLIVCASGWWLWARWTRSRPTPIEELRATIQARQESLRKAAATEYRRKREPWNP